MQELNDGGGAVLRTWADGELRHIEVLVGSQAAVRLTVSTEEWDGFVGALLLEG